MKKVAFLFLTHMCARTCTVIYQYIISVYFLHTCVRAHVQLVISPFLLRLRLWAGRFSKRS